MSVEIKHSKIDLLKMKHQQTYSESLFDIPYAPDFQCPTIDKIVKAIRYIDKLSSKVDRLDEDELRDQLNEVNSEIWGLESELEDIRKACDGLRNWGQGWKDQCKSIINDSDIDLEEFI